MNDLSPILSSVTAMALIALALVQPAVNGVKMVFPAAPAAALMGAALALGIALVNLLALASGNPFTVQMVALNTLAGLMAGFSSMGLHELGSRAADKRFNAMYAANYDHDADDNAAA